MTAQEEQALTMLRDLIAATIQAAEKFLDGDPEQEETR